MTKKKPSVPIEDRKPNVIGATAKPLYDKGTFIVTIKEMLPDSELLGNLRKTFQKGDVLLRENDHNKYLYIILEGNVEQVKTGEDVNTVIGRHGPGDFIGLLSFQTGEAVFTTARASSEVLTLQFDHQSFELFMSRYPQISKTLQGLIFSNLADRYRRVVVLHVEVATLSKELETERNQLKNTIKELERTRNALITQEKMATLGELTSGLAHEINNPASALLRSVDYLIATLPAMAERAGALPDTGLVKYFFKAGLERDFSDTALQRAKMKKLAGDYPDLGRTKVRVMAEMSDPVLEKLKPFARDPKNQALMQLLLDAYQSGVFMNGIRLSTQRIEYLVKSLKSYIRHSGKEAEETDLRQGIKETLLIIGNRLKDIKVELDLPQIPSVNCFVGEMNQVWTNLIINACDAMEEKGKLFISCGENAEQKKVWVKIADTGPGVPNRIKKRIFDSSFTTKTAGGDFGLGIGLAISKSIIEKHHGTIEVKDHEGGGAEFVITLPSTDDK